jgi:hypothetical protein
MATETFEDGDEIVTRFQDAAGIAFIRSKSVHAWHAILTADFHGKPGEGERMFQDALRVYGFEGDPNAIVTIEVRSPKNPQPIENEDMPF